MKVFKPHFNKYVAKKKISGFALPILIISIGVILMISLAVSNLASSNYLLAREDYKRLNSRLAADAGIDYGMVEINNDENWVGTASEIELFNDGDMRTTYEVSVADIGENEKTITSTGRSYIPATASTPTSERTFEITIEGLSSSGLFSTVTGVGGLTMSNNAKILSGDVYINGELTMTNSAQIGLAADPVNLKVAHQNCPSPPDAAYPRVCNSGENGQPISMSNSAHIYADVEATNQTDGSDMSDDGLVPNSSPPPQALPEHDREGQKNAVTNTISSFNCWGTQTQTWNANTHITGNAYISNSCQVTVLGDVWIDGNLIVSNNTRMIVAESVTERPSIMIDGSLAAFSNSAELVDNSNDIGFEIVTYKSDASCSPNCANVTGLDLYNSRNDITIQLNNNASAAESLLYARWTRVALSNGGDIGAVVGQTISMSNSSAITFGTSVGSGSSAPTWVIRAYKRIY